MFKRHEIRPGDDLSLLALRYGVTAGEIARANGLLLNDLDLVRLGCLEIPDRGVVKKREKAVEHLTEGGMEEAEAKYYLDVAEWDIKEARKMYNEDLAWLVAEPPNKGLHIHKAKRCCCDILITGGIVTHDFVIFECRRYGNHHIELFICIEKYKEGVTIREDSSFDRLLTTSKKGRRSNPKILQSVEIPVLLPVVTVFRPITMFLDTRYSLTRDNCKHFANSVLKVISNEIQNENDRQHILKSADGQLLAS